MATNAEIANMTRDELAKFASYEWEGIDDERSTQALIAAMAKHIADLNRALLATDNQLRAIRRDQDQQDKEAEALARQIDRHAQELRQLTSNRT